MKRVTICRVKNNFTNQLKNHLSENRKKYILFFSVALLGIVAALCFPPKEEVNYFYIKYFRLLNDPETEYYNFALQKMFTMTFILAVDYFCIFNRYLVIINGFFIFIASFHTMSSVILIISEFGMGGILSCVLIILPFGLITLALLVAASVKSYIISGLCYSGSQLKKHSKSLLIFYIVIIIAFCILSPIEAALFKAIAG